MDVLLMLAGIAKMKWYWVVLFAVLIVALKIILNAGWRADAGLSVMPASPVRFFLANLFGALLFYGIGKGVTRHLPKDFPWC
jgi:hypothetical protein